MAERRMVSLKIIDTDKFLDMPATTRLLYFDFCARGDDDGFISSPKKIIKMTNSNDDDYKLLLIKGYLIPFESGVCVIKDWRTHNYIQNDRYKPTIYTEEKSQLEISGLTYYKKNEMYPDCIQNVRVGKDRLGKERIGKDKIDKDRLEKEQEHKFNYFVLLEKTTSRPLGPMEVDIINQWSTDNINHEDIIKTVSCYSDGTKNVKYIDTVLRKYIQNKIIKQENKEEEKLINISNYENKKVSTTLTAEESAMTQEELIEYAVRKFG